MFLNSQSFVSGYVYEQITARYKNFLPVIPISIPMKLKNSVMTDPISPDFLDCIGKCICFRYTDARLAFLVSRYAPREIAFLHLHFCTTTKQ